MQSSKIIINELEVNMNFIDKAEVQNAIKNLKNHKAAGVNQIVADFN